MANISATVDRALSEAAEDYALALRQVEDAKDALEQAQKKAFSAGDALVNYETEDGAKLETNTPYLVRLSEDGAVASGGLAETQPAAWPNIVLAVLVVEKKGGYPLPKLTPVKLTLDYSAASTPEDVDGG